MGVGLLIFYVANVANVANVIKVHFAAFFDILSRAKAVPLHRISKRAETTKTTKTTKNYARNYESPYLPAAQPKHKGRVQPPTALPNAYHAYLRQDCRRTRHLRRPR